MSTARPPWFAQMACTTLLLALENRLARYQLDKISLAKDHQKIYLERPCRALWVATEKFICLAGHCPGDTTCWTTPAWSIHRLQLQQMEQKGVIQEVALAWQNFAFVTPVDWWLRASKQDANSSFQYLLPDSCDTCGFSNDLYSSIALAFEDFLAASGNWRMKLRFSFVLCIISSSISKSLIWKICHLQCCRLYLALDLPGEVA